MTCLKIERVVYNVNSVWMALPPSTRREVKVEVPKAQNKQAFSSLRIDMQEYIGGQMSTWPVFAWCNGGKKSVLPK